MPAIDKIRLPSALYSIEILNGEMDAVNNDIIRKKSNIAELNTALLNATSELTNLQYQQITLYIQATGQFPPS